MRRLLFDSCVARFAPQGMTVGGKCFWNTCRSRSDFVEKGLEPQLGTSQGKSGLSWPPSFIASHDRNETASERWCVRLMLSARLAGRKKSTSLWLSPPFERTSEDMPCRARALGVATAMLIERKAYCMSQGPGGINIIIRSFFRTVTSPCQLLYLVAGGKNGVMGGAYHRIDPVQDGRGSTMVARFRLTCRNRVSYGP
ncbi:uncharacterized protein LY79DRAFT_111233 [Colletotrichum navitas]|uniref:Uncharacterized protein n=1 Tax=Colletotrichum navitas TaxID=681940 RepID=A0AAD8Q3M6_9PEZI|nr:uncharacterized protein LY79DRAFT_111233 [Colletotrichum navitas]KAK1595336.1 hypothetical protein LY79DRAFT_111233 [Colletotrichum navitas]